MAHIHPPPVLAYINNPVLQFLADETGDVPIMDTRTLIGILVAISGNVLISFAMNLQKLAHKRIENQRLAELDQTTTLAKSGGNGVPSTLREESHEDLAQHSRQHSTTPSNTGDSVSTPAAETSALLDIHFDPSQTNYGSIGSESISGREPGNQITSTPDHMSDARKPSCKLQTSPMLATVPVDIVSEETVLRGVQRKKLTKAPSSSSSVEDNEGDYLKSKIWWLGFLLINIGESGNFISYAFAPASVVAPLGSFALVANCIFAPVMLKERYRGRDLVGVIITIIGAVTVVLASNASDTRLDVDGLLQAIMQLPFILFSAIYIVGMVALALLSQTNYGRRFVFVDVGLCALFGGFTVLSTKALATLLASEGVVMFTKWITYLLIVIIAGTGIGQIRYLNRALMRFDSKMVVPSQFVFFTLSAIIGSAILYGDFEKAQFHQIVTFLYGCAATFAGVFILMWTSNDDDHVDVNDDLDAEGALLGTDDGVNSVLGSPDRPRASMGFGTLGHRRRATLVLPGGVAGLRDTHNVRHKHSTLGMGISPAQHLLLVHTPPAELSLSSQLREDRFTDSDAEMGGMSSPESYGRHRTWYGGDHRPVAGDGGHRPRTGSLSAAGQQYHPTRH